MRAVEAAAAGGPEAMVLVDRPDPLPGPGELVVDLIAAGVNYIDTYRRAGVYPVPFPHVPGLEGAGRVIAAGEDVADVDIGSLVAWASAPASYAEQVVVPASQAVPVPDGLDPVTAAAVLLQGMTAQYLVDATFPLREGQDALVHAAAGGVGLLLTQLASARGAHVVGTVSTKKKEVLAREAGAADVLLYADMPDLAKDLPPLVRARTGGAGVHVAYDGVGAATFEASLASLRPRGMLVLYGASSGVVPPFDLQRLNGAGSIYVTRPNLQHYTPTRADLLALSATVFDAVLSGQLRVRVGATFSLAEAADAHRLIEARGSTGKVVLIP